MSLPQVLCVDDSEAILTLERTALSGSYLVATASDGVEALELATKLKPACVLLDISMPRMDGDEVLARMKADPALREIPVVIVTSEEARAEQCLQAGAAAYLPKPLRASEVLATVERALEDARRRERRDGLAVVVLSIGGVSLAITLDGVDRVVLEPETTPLPGGPPHVRRFFELEGEPVCILDLAEVLKVEHGLPVQDRCLVVVERSGVTIALSVDRVSDPEEIPPAEVTRPSRLGGTGAAPLDRSLIAFARTTRGQVPVLEPGAFLARDLAGLLPELLARARAAEAAS